MVNNSVWWQRAQQVMPGGVNSPVRAFRGVGGDPIFFRSGKGAYLTAIDEKHYIDYVCSWGPLILGHAHPAVVAAVEKAATQGLSFGAPTPGEVEFAELICRLIPSIEKVRLINSGTEATMTALRLARAYTQRDKILKFEGCYHGHSDALLADAGSGVATLGIPGTAGVPEAVVRDTITLPYNDCERLEQLFKKEGGAIAAIIVEPIAANMNFVVPSAEFLRALRDYADRYGAILIFDEVITGFRVALGGAQSLYRIKPDLTTLGKIIGGGLPMGAVGGRRDIIDKLAPLGPSYQAGTLSGNPIAVAAGLTTLQILEETPGIYQQLAESTHTLLSGLELAAERAHIPFKTAHAGSVFGLYFTDRAELPRHYEDVKQTNHDRFKQFFHAMLKRGVYLAPSPFEVGFVSLAHVPEVIEKTITIASEAMAELR